MPTSTTYLKSQNFHQRPSEDFSFFSMRRKQSEMGGGSGGGGRWSLPLLILVSLAACTVAYFGLTFFLRPPQHPVVVSSRFDPGVMVVGGEEEEGTGGCCRGIDHMELWGDAVKWGNNFKFNSSKDCCKACKDMCKGNDGPCLCDSWVFCGDKVRCKEKFGECWLKKQKDAMVPAVQNRDDAVIWTSGLIFGNGEGIIGLHTEYGTLHVKLFPECAPYSVSYIIELLGNRHCAGCRFYRAESRGTSWNAAGNHIDDTPLGPPYGLIQGTLEAEGLPFNKLPKEECPLVRRGSVAWVGSGPEFIISLANHHEWKRTHTIFGSVLPEDMDIAEKIAHLPTSTDVWSNIEVSVLEKPVSFKVKRVTKSHGDINFKSNANSGSES